MPTLLSHPQNLLFHLVPEHALQEAAWTRARRRDNVRIQFRSPRLEIPMRNLVPVIAFLLASQSQIGSQTLSVPNGSLSVAYRQMEDGKLSDSVHQAELFCWNGECRLTTVTLNQCLPSSDGPAFFPKVERSSTTDGELAVRNAGVGVIDVEQLMGGARFLYRFSYRERPDPALAKTFRLSSSRFFSALTNFSGSVIKTSDVLDKVVSWDLKPLKGAFAFVEAKCKMMLNGVP